MAGGIRVLAVTGTPGTGKTVVSATLRGRFAVVDANELARRVGAIVGRDRVRSADVVDEGILRRRARAALEGQGDVLVEGLLSHFCEPDLVVVLRCHPALLRERLVARGWPPAKIEENVLAETLDAVSQEIETVPAWELDTSGLTPGGAGNLIAALFRGERVAATEMRPIGGFDWTGTLVGGPSG